MDRISKNNYDNKQINLFKTRKSLIIIYIIVLILLVLLSIFGTYIYKAKGNLSDAAINMMADVAGYDTPISVLVLGVSEDIDTMLTDTMMLASYNPKSQKAFVLSIPRDTYIGTNKSTANPEDRINSLYQKDISKTILAVEKLTGINIDNYVVVKTSALTNIVDAIGGVEFNVPINMKYDDPTQNLHINLKAGMQNLNGDEAEQLLRFRHSNPDKNGKMTTYPAEYGADDFGRMRTQREFLQATAKQLLSFKNISKIKNIASAVFDNLETDMSFSKIIGYIPSALQIDIETIKMEQLPGVSNKINGVWFYETKDTEICKLMNELVFDLELADSELNKMYTPIKNIPIVANKEQTTSTVSEQIADEKTMSKVENIVKKEKAEV